MKNNSYVDSPKINEKEISSIHWKQMRIDSILLSLGAIISICPILD